MILVKDKYGKEMILNEPTTQMATMQNRQPFVEHIGISQAATGPNSGQQAALNMQAGTRTLQYQVKNTAVSGAALKAVIFDAYKAYATLNSYTKPETITVEAKNFVETLFLEKLKTGFTWHCFRIDYVIQKPTDDISQFSNPIEAFTHSENITKSQPLPSINPNDYNDAYVNQSNVKTMSVDFEINSLLALTTSVEPDTILALTLHVAIKKI